jgi:hypothetical protein
MLREPPVRDHKVRLFVELVWSTPAPVQALISDMLTKVAVKSLEITGLLYPIGC